MQSKDFQIDWLRTFAESAESCSLVMPFKASVP